MKYQHMKFCKLLSELDSEEKTRAWIWLAKFDGKEFICPKCSNETCWQHHKNPEVWECRKCHFEVRLRAGTIFQKSKTPLLIIRLWAQMRRYWTIGYLGSINSFLTQNPG